MKKNVLACMICFISFTAFAQSTDYSTVATVITFPATRPQYSMYKTYDLAVFTTQDESDKADLNFKLPFQLAIPGLQQLDKDATLHFIALLQRYKSKVTAPNTASVNITLTTFIYDRAGKLIIKSEIDEDDYIVNFGRMLSRQELDNKETVRQIIMERAIERCVSGFTSSLADKKENVQLRIASLEDIKKKPALKDFETQAKELKSALVKDGLPGFKNAAAPFVSYWQNMTSYTDTDSSKANEVRRAAYQNLVVYYLAADNFEQAATYIEPYKAIDKTIKEMMGLIKYKNSEELEKIISKMQRPAVPAPVDTTAEPAISTETLLTNFSLHQVQGTVTMNSKNDAGTYKGLIKVSKIATGSWGNFMSLDPERVNVTVETKDANGQPKVINTTISKIENLTADNGDEYHVEKFGTVGLGGARFSLMKTTFKTDKVKVYRSVLPEGSNDYFVIKTGDDKGVKSSMIGAFKNLVDYFSDNPAIAEAVKNGTISKSDPIEKIAEMYSGKSN